MSAAPSAPAAVIGLDSGRRGEFAQVELLGRALGHPFERVRLDADDGVPPDEAPRPRPALVVAFGRGAAAAVALGERYRPRVPVALLGTPGRGVPRRFDLVMVMPQDDYPAGTEVLRLLLPLNGARPDAGVLPHRGSGSDGTVMVVGGASRHMRLGRRELRRMAAFGARLAAANGEDLRIVGSPRTPPRMRALLRQLAAAHGATLHEGRADDDRGFPDLLERGARFLLSADSASMLAETCRTGAPVWLFPLPHRADGMRLLQESCDRIPGGRAVRHALVRRGWLGGGTDFRRWHRALERAGFLRLAADQPADALRWRPEANRPDPDLAACLNRLLPLLRPGARPETIDGGG